jgi:septum formation protein
MSQPIILASNSPRRSQLLTQADIGFEKFVVEVDESGLGETYSGPLEQLGEHLAGEKALATWQALGARGMSGRRVLASDTTVLLAGRSLAKPANAVEATAMLRELRRREHIVATGVALLNPAHGKMVSATSATRVLMRDYGDDEIAAYVATGDPLDKAGSYSIQHPGFQPVESLRGCHLGVIGLPVCIVARLLGKDSAPDMAGVCPYSELCTRPYPTEALIVRTQALPDLGSADAAEAAG